MPYKFSQNARKKINWVVDKDGCFICTSHSTSSFGHPIVGEGIWGTPGKQKRLHRFIYEEMFGEIPEGMCVCHKCDKPACINPEHLFLGTKRDNNIDCINKGRNYSLPHHKGELHGMAKLTENQVRDIRSDTRSLSVLGKIYGISKTNIADIKKRKIWKHVA